MKKNWLSKFDFGVFILRRRRRTPPGLSHWLEHTVCENTLIWYSIFYGDRSIVTCDYITECVVWPSRLLESFWGPHGRLYQGVEVLLRALGRFLGGSWEALGRLVEASKRHLRPKTVIATIFRRFF